MRNGCLADPDSFESELPFLDENMKICKNHPGNFFQRNHAALSVRRVDRMAGKADRSDRKT
jgi:hypothetical protein